MSVGKLYSCNAFGNLHLKNGMFPLGSMQILILLKTLEALRLDIIGKSARLAI